jgi:hypothetical protein
VHLALQLELVEPDFYRMGYIRHVRAYGVEFKEGPEGIGVYSAKNIPCLEKPRVHFLFYACKWCNLRMVQLLVVLFSTHKIVQKSFSCERGVLADVCSSVFEFSIECSSLNMKILAWA